MAIASSVGLISGIDYTTLVDQLIAIDRIPQDNLVTRANALIAEETALTNLATYFFQASYLVTGVLNKAASFRQTDVSSSNSSLLSAAKSSSATAATGSYTFTPIRTAAAQQTIASGVSSSTIALNKTGEITIGKSWSLENDVNLSDLNGGDGFIKGYIRITDGSGARATIDLRSCVTMNDVLDKINENTDIDVVAEVDGSKLVLTDMSDGDHDKLKVQEVSGGRTAASLGLVGDGVQIDTNEGTITGNSIYRLGENMQISSLNDGNGLSFSNALNDLRITTKDGSEIIIDFNERTAEGADSKVLKELTLGDVVKTINNAQNNDGKIVARIEGKSLVIEDTTGVNYIEAKRVDDGDGNFDHYELPDGYTDDSLYDIDADGYIVDEGTTDRVVDPTSTGKTKIQQIEGNNVPILKSLGLIDGLWNSNMPVEFTGSITTRQLIGDLDSSLMSSLNGGYGFSNSAAGAIEVQDRLGNAATLTFDADELKTMQAGSINDVIKLMNSKLAAENIGIEVAVNDTKTGLMLLDTTTGNKTHNLIFKDKIEQVQDVEADGTPKVDSSNNPVMLDVDPNIAKTLGLDVDSASSIVNGKSLNKQTVSYNTLLSDLNGGKGVTVTGGQINISDSSGRTATIFLDTTRYQTLGDVISAINDTTRSGTTAPRILARINSTGDGFEVIDLAAGSGSFSITDGGSSKICAELGLAGTVTQAEKDPDTGWMTLNARQTKVITLEETDTLETIRDKINSAGGNFNASIVADGSSGLPYRLMITGGTTGAAGGMNVDLSALGLTTENMQEAQNAILVYGDPNSSSAIYLQSKNNTFNDVVDGINVSIAGYSSEPITVTVAETNTDLKAALSQFVTNYNTFRTNLTAQTYYYVDYPDQSGVLANNTTARNMERLITDVLLKTVSGIPGITSLQDIGISVAKNIDADGNFIETHTNSNTLTFDEAKFDALWASNKEGIEKFFYNEVTILDPAGGTDPDTGEPKTTTVNRGWAQMFADMSETVAGDDGLIFSRLQTIGTMVTDAEERYDYMEARLEFKRTTMLNKFYAMEQAMAKMSANMETVSAISSTWTSNAAYYNTSSS
jgi:flagellar hook-associated protein 2